MKKYTIPGSVIVMPEKNKNWILMNVHTREVLGVDLLSLEALRMLENGTKPNSDLKYKVWNIGRFSNEDGLLADPSRFVRDVDSWPSSELLSINKLLKLYQKMGFLVSNYDDYIDTLSYKDSFLDESKLGNFHQQLGRHLLMNKRVNPDEWWLNQKFLDDFSNTQNNLYRSIQDNYLEGYFANHLDSSMSVLDLGCGPGYYTNKIGEIVEKVVGIDPSQQFVDIANKNKSSKAEYHVMNLGKLGALDQIEDNAFDIVHKSNMSKSCVSEEEADLTIQHYLDNPNLGYDTPDKRIVGDRWVIFNKSTGKILKNINYTPANLKNPSGIIDKIDLPFSTM
jgi:SAM-dependent methyltransferase